jgi:hypothetical protein
MAGILKSNISTYEFSLDEIKELICADLQLEIDQVTVEYVIEEVNSDPMDRYRGTDEVTKIRVTVKN